MTTYTIYVPSGSGQPVYVASGTGQPLYVTTSTSGAVISQLQNCQIMDTKPILAELTINFEDCQYEVKIDEINKTYTLNSFLKVMIVCVPKNRFEVIVIVDVRADLAGDQKTMKENIEELMHKSTSTMEEVDLALQKFKTLGNSSKYYSFVTGTVYHDSFNLSLYKDQFKYAKSFVLYTNTDKASIQMSMCLIFKNSSLLPDK
jgi:hypothetical protein